MKKLLIFAVVATMFAACSKDATQDLAAAKPIDKFYATIADNDSRVQLNDACKTVWTSGDRVSVFNKTTGNRRYKFTGNTGDTVGELSYLSGGTTGSAIDKTIAIYPYNISNTVSSYGTITTVIPATQTYIKNSFGIGSCIMVAHSDTEELSFQNVMGWIRIALTGDKDKVVKSIVLSGYNHEPLAGNATIANDLSIKFGSDAAQSVTLDCGEGVQLSAEPTYFYIAVVPQTFSKGLYIEIVDTNNSTATLYAAKSITIERNHIVPMAEFEYNNKHVKPIPNQIWYTTSDGKIITPKRYDGKIVSNIYSNGKGIITFDCAQKTIGNEAFQYCQTMTSITIPDSVTTIGYWVFDGCTGLTSVTIPDSITSIGTSAFDSCTGLTSITIPDSVTSIGQYAFRGCTGLKDVHITDLAAWCSIIFYGYDSNPLYSAHNLYLNGSLVTNLVIPDSFTSINNYAFYGCTSLTSVTIPDSVTSIGHYAFRGCNGLTSVTIPDSVTAIRSYAFAFCSGLTSVTIPDSVTSIGESAFEGCKGLTSVTIPDSVTAIRSYTFAFCSGLISVTIPNRVTNIDRGAFQDCTSLTSVAIPDSVTSIDIQAFLDCTGLTSVIIGNGVSSIGDEAFRDCTRLTSVHINDIAAWCSIKFVNTDSNPINYAHNLYLNGKLVTDLVIPDSVTSIGRYAFYGCTGLTNVTIPDSVKSIGYKAFYKCTSLTSVTIPDSVTTIGEYAFEDCTSLTSITIPDSITSIDESAFSGCTGLTSVTIPDSVTSIGSSAFYGCTSLTSVTIPDSVTSIGGWAFARCTGLTSVTINKGVTKIGGHAFSGCTGLTSVTISKGVTQIGDSAFSGCTGKLYINCTIPDEMCSGPFLGSKFTDIIIGNSVISIGKHAFENYTSLTSITISDNVTAIGACAFYGCTGLTSVTIPNSVTWIAWSAFCGCTGLTSITIPNSVNWIGEYAFNDCTGLTSIYCKPTTPPTLGNSDVFYNIASDAKIYVPRASLNTYKSAYLWNNHASKIVGYYF